jgi:predicted ATPase/DNA-binding CsgD family transcriptional regulator
MQDGQAAIPHPTLPAQPTTFIGRKQEVARFCALLQRPEVRLLTLTGPAGVGKTRLALQMGTELFTVFPDGVFFIPLASVTDPQQVIITLLQVLSIHESGTLSPSSALQAALREKRLLLILDNFEQVVEASSSVAALLAGCPGLKILVTSRIALHLQAEWEVVVSPLSIPISLPSIDLDHLQRYESVALFVARSQAAKADFQMTHATARTIAAICTRLDGLPLALELAAARIKYFSPLQLFTQLTDALAVLSQGAHDLPARQRTLRGAIAWSYQLLSEAEQHLFRCLSVFVESWDEEAATSICLNAGLSMPSVLEGMLSLVDKSLLWIVQQDELSPRFRMLQLLRDFGLSCLEATGETEAMREAHATYYLRLAEHTLTAHIPTSQQQWHGLLEREHHNLRVALVWFLDRARSQERSPEDKHHAIESALRLCLALSAFWIRRGYYREARTFFELALRSRTGVAPDLQARALYQIFFIKTIQDDYEAAEAHLAESLALYEQLGDTRGRATCLTGFVRLAFIRCEFEKVRTLVAEVAALCQQVEEYPLLALALTDSVRASVLQGNYQEAQVLLDKSLKLYQEAEDPDVLLSQTRLAWILFLSNQDLPRARMLAEQSLQGWRDIGEQEQIAFVLKLLGQIHLSLGEARRAQEMFEQSLGIVEGTLDRAGKAEALIGLARVYLEEHDPESACRLFEQSVALLREIASRLSLATALEGWGFALAMKREFVRAVQLWGASEVARETFGIKRPPIEHPTYERWVAEVRNQLDEKTWTQALTQGREMTLEHLLATDVTDEGEISVSPPFLQVPATSSSSLSPSGLTARELEVLRLLAQGLSNGEIAEQLVISPRTVSTHLTSIYGKISVSSRSAATRYALENHLV